MLVLHLIGREFSHVNVFSLRFGKKTEPYLRYARSAPAFIARSVKYRKMHVFTVPRFEVRQRF